MWWPLGSWVVELATSLKLNVLAPFLCTVGNVVTETDQQIQKTIDAGMLKVLGQLPKHQSSEGGCLGRVLRLQLNLLTAPDKKIITIILDIISYLLWEPEELHQKERLYLLIEEVGGLEKNRVLTVPAELFS
ncbi:hypothetical protein U0070_014256 [Myodes glareolus]|uniref:Uncharacterized protein n=1 Tax=Myodes glareolus TaxID=447135 RepID=A0AAW0H812_MYOGA